MRHIEARFAARREIRLIEKRSKVLGTRSSQRQPGPIRTFYLLSFFCESEKGLKEAAGFRSQPPNPDTRDPSAAREISIVEYLVASVQSRHIILQFTIIGLTLEFCFMGFNIHHAK